MIRAGRLYKRREVRSGDALPVGFEIADHDEETGKVVGWVPVGDGPEDRYHREAFTDDMHDGTYELVGPKIQGNPEGFSLHRLINHDGLDLVMPADPPRTFSRLSHWLAGKDIEGIVFRHSDGRMAKIKLRDFGLRRNATSI